MLFCGLLSLIVLLFYNSPLYISFLAYIMDILERHGLSTRIIQFALDGTVVSYTSGRNELYDWALNRVLENPFVGYGIYGEWPWVGWSIHNMYLEILLHFGFVGGGILLFAIVSLVIRTYLKTKNEIAKDLILIWASFVFIRGIFGGSYLQFPMFFLLGFCIQELRRLTHRINYSL